MSAITRHEQLSDAELAEQGYRVLCWTCNYSTCECGSFDNMPKLVFSRPLPRNSKGLPMTRPTERVILPAGTKYEAWRTVIERGAALDKLAEQAP